MITLCTYANDLRLESSLTHALGTNTLRRLAEEHDWGVHDPKPGKLNFPSRSSRPSRSKMRDIEVSYKDNLETALLPPDPFEETDWEQACKEYAANPTDHGMVHWTSPDPEQVSHTVFRALNSAT